MPLTDNTAQWGVRRLTKFQDNNGIPVGFEYFSTNPNIPTGSLPLFGGEYSRTVYADLWSWVQEQAGYLIEESEWQAKASANDGNVPYYSDGDGSTTFRVPSLKCWVKGANGIEEVGSYLSAGLPQIELVNKTTTNVQGGTVASKAGKVQIASTGLGMYAISSSYGLTSAVGFNLQQHPSITPVEIVPSDEIYGNSTTVQPKSIVGMWLVKAYGTVSNVGSTDVSAIAQGLTELETRQGDYVNKTLASDKELVVSWCMPNYSAGVEFYSVPYIAPADGYIFIRNAAGTDSIVSKIYINDVWVAYEVNAEIQTFIPVSKGDTLTGEGLSALEALFFPTKR